MQEITTSQADDADIAGGISSIYPPLALLIVVGLLIFWSYDYGETARRLPLLVSFGMLLLIALDILSRFHSKVGMAIRLALGAGFQDRELTHEPEWRAELVQVLWLALCVLGIALIGILPTIPLFIFSYMLIQGKQKIGFSLMIATLVLTVVGVVFELLLEYDLYRGMLLNEYGIE
ncbi:MAG: tripartite tricarboxylate transporter TctB family protein [Gammaproteobacteria bacterium]|nr:tripartite tricarboxylate transporter TctB family protein [Gammaproteobacteria bacterium]